MFKPTLLSLQKKTGIFANSVDPDEDHQNLHGLPVSVFFRPTPCLQQWTCPNSLFQKGVKVFFYLSCMPPFENHKVLLSQTLSYCQFVVWTILQTMKKTTKKQRIIRKINSWLAHNANPRWKKKKKCLKNQEVSRRILFRPPLPWPVTGLTELNVVIMVSINMTEPVILHTEYCILFSESNHTILKPKH